MFQERRKIHDHSGNAVAALFPRYVIFHYIYFTLMYLIFDSRDIALRQIREIFQYLSWPFVGEIGQPSGSAKLVVQHWNYRTISRSPESILTLLKERGGIVYHHIILYHYIILYHFILPILGLLYFKRFFKQIRILTTLKLLE